MNISNHHRETRGNRQSAGSGGVPSTRTPFVAALAKALDGRCAVSAGDRLVLAVSGGADSMAMLLGMTALSRRSHRGYELVVAHVNHHLRSEATAEALAVQEVAARLEVQCVICDVHPSGAAGNLAAAARELRYGALARVVAESQATALVTAHHGTDQLETVVMSLVRGAGLEGLAGLAWRARRWGIDIVRPLLDRTHEDCIELCRKCDWSWIEDPTNVDESRRRSSIRARLLPLLLDLAPEFDRRVHRTADLMRQAAQLVDRRAAVAFQADAEGAFDRAALVQEGGLVVGAGLRDAAGLLGSPRDELTQEVVRPVVDAIMQTSVRRPRRFDWPGGVVIEVRSRRVRVLAKDNR